MTRAFLVGVIFWTVIDMAIRIINHEWALDLLILAILALLALVCYDVEKQNSHDDVEIK